MDIIDRLSELKKTTPRSGMSREKAIEFYLSHGGILKIEGEEDSKELIYPNRDRIESQLDQAISKLNYLENQLKGLEKRHSSSYDSAFVSFGKFVDPLYWQHHVKMAIDSEYKKSYDTVKPPINKLKNKKWRNVAKTFIKNEEYRKNMYEARTSQIGKDRESMAESIEKTLQSNRDLMDRRIKKTKKEKDFFDQKVNALKALREFSMESEKTQP